MQSNKKSSLETIGYIKEIPKDANINDYEKIKIFKLIETSWSVDGGELTATMKLRRKNILEKYKNLYEEIYKS